jgi:heme oxygenase
VRTSRTWQRLDTETRPLHAAADAAWRSLLVEDVTQTTYAAQLARVYGFEGPLEAAFAYTPNIATVIDVRRRMRSGFLAQDLLALDLQASLVATLPCLAIAPFAHAADALGWMYVVERATPLHGEVRDYLILRLPRVERACTYLSAYDSTIGSRRIELGDALDRVAGKGETLDRILVAAVDALCCATDWYCHHRSSMRHVSQI